MSSSPLSVPTTQPAFIEWQSTIRRSILPPKILGQKAKGNHKGDSTRATNKLGLICKKVAAARLDLNLSNKYFTA